MLFVYLYIYGMVNVFLPFVQLFELSISLHETPFVWYTVASCFTCFCLHRQRRSDDRAKDYVQCQLFSQWNWREERAVKFAWMHSFINEFINEFTGLHFQKAYTHWGTSCPQCVHQIWWCIYSFCQILLLSAHACMHIYLTKLIYALADLVYALAGGSTWMSVRLLGM